MTVSEITNHSGQMQFLKHSTVFTVPRLRGVSYGETKAWVSCMCDSGRIPLAPVTILHTIVNLQELFILVGVMTSSSATFDETVLYAFTE